MQFRDMEPCRIEDRRMPTSMHKPSTIVDMVCEDCGKPFIVIVAVADTSRFTEVCDPCMDTRPYLTAWKCGLSDNFRLGPNSDLDDVLLLLACKDYEIVAVSYNNGDVRMWELSNNEGKATAKEK